VVSGSRIFKAVIGIGLTCLVLSVGLTVFTAFVPIPNATQLFAMLSDGFKLCLGAILALMGEQRVGKER
jgi:hypothetical protein